MNTFEWEENIPVTANNLNEMQNILNNNITTSIENQYNLITDGSGIKTGRQIDGKDEYVVRVDGGNMPNNTTKTVTLPVSLINVTLTKPILLYGQSSTYEYPIMQTGITWYIHNGNLLNITTTSDRSRFACYVELYYTIN